MRKAEAILYCNEKELEGWITHKLILELYDDYEDIPESIIGFICYEPIERQPFIILCGSEFKKVLDKAAEEFIMWQASQEIIDSIDKKVMSQ